MAHTATQAEHEHHGHHITPQKTLLMVFLALVALTVITVLTAQIDLGVLNVPLALAIAATKASLVVMVFMALKYDNPVNTLVFSMGSIFVLVFLVFTLFDTMFRGDVGNVATETVMDTERMEEVMRARDPGAAAMGADTTRAASDSARAAPDTSVVAPDRAAGAAAASADTAGAAGATSAP